MTDDRIVKLGGRAYRAVAVSTVERGVVIMGRVRTARRDARPMEPEKETAEPYALRVLEALLVSPGVLELVGALIIPQDVERDELWTPQLAADTARFVGRLTSPQDKAVVKQLLLGLLIPFLESGLGNWTATLHSSGSRAPQVPGSASLETASNTGSGPA